MITAIAHRAKCWLGTVIAVTDSSGNSLGVDAYDEFGVAATANIGRFQYTGQIVVPELGLYYYKARIYSPKWGRFLQTDPIGYQDDNNLYTYVGNDPMNRVDPTGTEEDLPKPEDSNFGKDTGEFAKPEDNPYAENGTTIKHPSGIDDEGEQAIDRIEDRANAGEDKNNAKTPADKEEASREVDKAEERYEKAIKQWKPAQGTSEGSSPGDPAAGDELVFRADGSVKPAGEDPDPSDIRVPK